MTNAWYLALFTGTKEFFSSHSGTLRLAGLFGILSFSFWAGMSPHWDSLYPLHIDEWFAIGFTQSTLDAGGLEYANPYGPGEIAFHPEMGFHLLLGFLQTVTDLSWLGMYRVAPGVLMALLAFVTYSFGRRAGFGWAAAIFVSLIPTSIRVLGPSFVVPVTAGMLLIPVTLLVLHVMWEKNRRKALWLLTLLIGGAIFIHPPTGVILTALVGVYLAGFVGEAFARRRFGEGFGLVVAALVRISIPVVLLGLWLPTKSKEALEQLNAGASGSGSLLGLETRFIEAFGIPAVVLFVLGLFVFIARGDFGVRTYMLTVFTGLLLAFLVFLVPVFGFGPDILYRRGWLYLGLLMAIFAGYGVAVYFRSIPVFAAAVASRFRRPVGAWTAVLMWIIGIAVVVSVLVTSLITNEERDSYAGYYNLINERMYTDFRWIEEHTVPEQTVAIGEPGLAWAYSPVAGPGATVFEAVAFPWTNRRAEKLRDMLSHGEADVKWLDRAGISVLYACRPQNFDCEELTGDGLFKVRRGVYLLPALPDNQ